MSPCPLPAFMPAKHLAVQRHQVTFNDVQTYSAFPRFPSRLLKTSWQSPELNRMVNGTESMSSHKCHRGTCHVVRPKIEWQLLPRFSGFNAEELLHALIHEGYLTLVRSREPDPHGHPPGSTAEPLWSKYRL